MMELVKEKMKTLNDYLNNFSENRSSDQLKHGSPGWLDTYKKAAGKRFREKGFPQKKWENWRFINLEPLLGTMFNEGANQIESNRDPNRELNRESNKKSFRSKESIEIHIIDGAYEKNQKNKENQEKNKSQEIKGLSIQKLSESETARRGLESRLNEEKNPFALLNASQIREGVVISVSENTTLARPIHIRVVNSPDSANLMIHPRIVIQMNQGSRAKIVLSIGEQYGKTFNNTVVDIELESGAQLEYVTTNPETIDGYRFETMRCRCQKKSNLDLYYISKGSQLTKFDTQVKLLGEESHCNIFGYSLLANDSQLYSDTAIYHTVPKCKSDQIFKNIITGESQSEFITLVKIFKDAQQNYTNQTNNNLVLSPKARALSRPQLIIDADDVKCNHGATVGQLDDEQLYYLMCRGLSRDQSRSILMRGFMETIINEIPIEFVREFFQNNLDRDLSEIL